jgi:hypothetical protein
MWTVVLMDGLAMIVTNGIVVVVDMETMIARNAIRAMNLPKKRKKLPKEVTVATQLKKLPKQLWKK